MALFIIDAMFFHLRGDVFASLENWWLRLVV